MQIEGNFIVTSSVQTLWDTIFDVKSLAECIPGVEKLEQISESTYDLFMVQKVGPVKVSMAGPQTLTKVEEPTYYEMEGEAIEIHNLGRVKDKVSMDLIDIGDGQVEINYTIHFTMVGKLSLFGDRIMRSKAAEIEKQFVINLQRKLNSI